MAAVSLRERIAHRYGGLRALLRFVRGQSALLLGRYRREQAVDWSRVQRLVFVCMGNICRSPLAESVARTHGYNTVSVGLQVQQRVAADPRAVAFAEREGYSLADHTSCPIDELSLRAGDLLIGMEPRHLQGLPRDRTGVQSTLLGLWDKPRIVYLHDPYSAADTYFESCEQRVVSGTLAICERATGARHV